MGTHRFARIMMIAFLLTTGFGLFAIKAPPAGATAEVCQLAAGGLIVCVEVRGKGGYVREVWGKVVGPGSKLKNPILICNYATKVRISSKGNQHYRTYENRAPKEQCGLIGGAYNIVPINETFPNGSYVCTTFFVDVNVQKGSEKCIKLT
jgi:heme A synthase